MTRVSAQTDRFHTDEGDIDLTFHMTFDVEGEEEPREPYSWGGSRGYDVNLSAELINLQLGELHMTREQASLRLRGEKSGPHVFVFRVCHS